ncbi:MAG: isoprenyl transferase [Candidatus Omnitrophica bacterium]|nr:isoprenyl transferase [Candidatus Omnitrophota bacterium]
MKNRIPKHIAIIMDGNGRWAERRRVPKIMGHREGVASIRNITKACTELGVKVLTLYAFSTENWKRSKKEVDGLMKLLVEFLKKEEPSMQRNNIRLMAIGRLKELPDRAYKRLTEVMDSTKDNKGLVFNLALNYGGRPEIVDAASQICRDVQSGKLSVSDINEETFESYLYTHGLPDLDLLIRTSGEMRISNFLLWQLSYAEIYVTDTLWPDFRKKNLVLAIEDFQGRERRYGGR